MCKTVSSKYNIAWFCPSFLCYYCVRVITRHPDDGREGARNML